VERLAEPLLKTTYGTYLRRMIAEAPDR
jgi:hypothetical protein